MGSLVAGQSSWPAGRKGCGCFGPWGAAPDTGMMPECNECRAATVALVDVEEDSELETDARNWIKDHEVDVPLTRGR
jgi:hypothetical protein